MIVDLPSYEQNPLIADIREKHGRINPERDSSTPTSLQDQLRSNSSEGGQSSGDVLEIDAGNAGNSSGNEADNRTTKRGDSRKRRANSTLDEIDGGIDGNINSIGRAFQFGKVDIDEKPRGIEAKPHAKEQAARGEQQPEVQSKKNFFAWLRSNNNGKATKDRPSKPRGRPLTEAEAERLKPSLIEALRDGLPLLDQAIMATNKRHTKPYLFASLDSEDIDKMATFWIKKARVSGEMAIAARTVIEYKEDVEVLMMVVPLLYQSLAFYHENGGFTLRGR